MKFQNILGLIVEEGVFLPTRKAVLSTLEGYVVGVVDLDKPYEIPIYASKITLPSLVYKEFKEATNDFPERAECNF